MKGEVRKEKLHLQTVQRWIKVFFLLGGDMYLFCLGSRVCPSIWGAGDRRRRGSVRRTHYEGVVPWCEHSNDGQPTGRHHGGSRRLFLPGTYRKDLLFSASLGGPDHSAL